MFDRDFSSWVILVALAFAAFALMRRATRRTGEVHADAGTKELVHRPSRTTRETDEPPVELLRWQVEMHETARELKSELDSKLAALHALVIVARRESERLEAAIAKAQSSSEPTKGAS